MVASAFVGILFTLFPWCGGIISSLPGREGIKTWYPTLDRPNWRPPNWLFGPVWTCLYLGMGYASFRVYQVAKTPHVPSQVEDKAFLGLTLYVAQLVLNLLWSPIMFWIQAIPLALADILALDVVAYATAYHFLCVDSVAGYLLIPYLAWISFATVLTVSLFMRNSCGKSRKA